MIFWPLNSSDLNKVSFTLPTLPRGPPGHVCLRRSLFAQLPLFLACNVPGPEAYLPSWPRAPVTWGLVSEATLDHPQVGRIKMERLAGEKR